VMAWPRPAGGAASCGNSRRRAPSWAFEGGSIATFAPPRPRGQRRGGRAGSRPDLALRSRTALPAAPERDLGRPVVRVRPPPEPLPPDGGQPGLLRGHRIHPRRGGGGGARGREAHPPEVERPGLVVPLRGGLAHRAPGGEAGRLRRGGRL